MIRILLLTLTLTVFLNTAATAQDYKQEPEYLALRDSMHHAFNDGDSVRFFPAVKALQDYLLRQGDTHAYYTQRCNEIVFEMNRRKVFEAYMLGRQLSMELREKGLDSEMYMAYNMLGHINNICGNKKAAKRNFYTVIGMMEKYGYYESMPPIYMNIVNVELNDDHEEAMRLLTKAKEIAEKYSPERVFDIETRRTISYYNAGEMDKFLEGYQAYKEGVKEGKSSVHGRTMEVYYLASQGEYDKAVELAREELGDDSEDAITTIYEKAGRWKEAYESLRKAYAVNDSVNNVALANSMQGIRDQLTINDMENKSGRNRVIALTIGIILLSLLMMAQVYIVFSRRRHMSQLNAAYKHALESDKMKTRFIQNVSHEVRTPLNIISGFSQVIADPDLTESVEERQNMAAMMQKSALQITTLIDEIIGLSLIESSTNVVKDDIVKVNQLLETIVAESEDGVPPQVTFRVDSQLEPEFSISTNKNMLYRIISALTDNALKNTEKGSVILKAKTVAQTLFIIVEDTGCGIPEDQAENIFERFVKLDSFKQGIGLGLPLSRKLAEQLGGIVTLDTSYTNGARFVVTLPFEEQQSSSIKKNIIKHLKTT
jgi:signal transduction histidine kinase